MKTGKYPIPEGEISTGTLSGEFSYKGEFGTTLTKQISFNKLPTDPKNNNQNYIYATTQKQNEYQIGTILEGELSSNKILNTTYASTNIYTAKVEGNYKGYAKYQNEIENCISYINIPSLIWNNTGTVNLLSTGSEQQGTPIYVINKGKNLPYFIESQREILFPDEVVREKTQKDKTKILTICEEDLKVLSDKQPEDLTSEEQEIIESFGEEKPKNIKEKILGDKSIPSYASCEGTPHNQTKTFWKEASVNYGNTCEAGIEFTCNNGIWKHTAANKIEYPSEVECVVGTPNICEIGGEDNGYILEEILHHGSGLTLTKTDTTFSNGEKILSQDYMCNNGILEKKETQEIGEITKCDTDYYENNSICEGVGVGYYSPNNAITRTACSNKPANSIYTTSGNGSNTCEYTCNTGYETQNCTPKNCSTASLNGYSIPATNHGNATNPTKSVAITGGTQIKTQNFSCNLGAFTSGTESISSTSCNTGYVKNGDICENAWSGNATTGFTFKDTSGTAQYPTSCNNLLTTTTWKNTFTGSPWNGSKFEDGIYFIKPDSGSVFNVHCDMTNNGGGWTRTHILRYVNLNNTFATSQNYTGHRVNSADNIWNVIITGADNSYFRPLKRMNDYTTWVWLTDTQYPNITSVTNSATNKSNGRKVDLQNYIDYWYQGPVNMGERDDYIVNAGAITGGTAYTITKGNCIRYTPYHTRGWRNQLNYGWEILVSHDNSGTCVWNQPPSIPFQFSNPGSGFPGMSISGLAVNVTNADQTMWHSLWVK